MTEASGMGMNDGVAALERLGVEFARTHLATRSDLHEQAVLDPDLRQAMARENLFRIGIPVEHGGTGGGWLHIAAMGQALAENGYNLGCVLSWLMHVMAARFLFLGFGTDSQKAACLPGLASGSITPCLAVSEPGVGGHPKKLTTRAERNGESFRITGEKAYLTNGPLAGLYVVLAVTGEQGGKKSYTAFIVPCPAPGLSRTGPIDLGFLRPCPHGGIVLDGCEASVSDVLGRFGHAYTDIALAFRQLEDVMMMGPFIGGARALAGLQVSCMKGRGFSPDGETAFVLGETASTLDSLEVVAREAARVLDAGGTASPVLLSLTLFMRRAAMGVQAGLSDLTRRSGVEMGQPYASLFNDLSSALRIAGNVARIRQEKLGRSLFS